MGKPPYVGDTAESTRQLAARAKLDDAHARLDACGAEPELVALCRRCLSPEPAGRPRHAGEVADAVHQLRTKAEDRARRAELDRARAEVQAAEQRKRRHVQLALAGVVFLLLAGSGAFAWWQDSQATKRRVEAESRDRDERERLARNADALADLVGRCEEALRDGNADRAASALGEIDRRLAEGGGESMTSRAERCRADLAVLRELDAIDTFRWTPVENKYPDRKEVAARWQAVFGRYRVVPSERQVVELEAADRVTGSLVRDRLLAALDLWLVFDPSPSVRAFLRAADPDGYRDAVRGAVADDAPARVAELAGQPAALTQPSGFAAALGRHTAVPAERRRAVLEAALRSRPRYLAHYNLGFTLSRNVDPPGAIATHLGASRHDPEKAITHNNLGEALKDKGNLDGAIAAFREAIRIDPKYAPAHNNLGIALQRKGDLDGAIAGFREAFRLNPKFAVAQQNLDRALKLKAERDAKIAPPTRPVPRRPTLDRFAADLAARRKLLAADPAKNRAAVHRAMAHWLTDPDLASVREQKELENLPLDERVAWVKFWTEVRELRDATAPPETAPPPRPVR